jgi:hypothetical protein
MHCVHLMYAFHVRTVKFVVPVHFFLHLLTFTRGRSPHLTVCSPLHFVSGFFISGETAIVWRKNATRRKCPEKSHRESVIPLKRRAVKWMQCKCTCTEDTYVLCITTVEIRTWLQEKCRTLGQASICEQQECI